MTPANSRIIVAITGASGVIYAVRFLRSLPRDYEVHLIISPVAEGILRDETGWDPVRMDFNTFLAETTDKNLPALNIKIHDFKDFYAPVASGSFRAEKMVIVPCSAKTLAGIASGYTNSLIERAADVQLKEGRKLVLVTRETPLNAIHLQNMVRVQQAGAVILPASPGFYHNPKSIDDLTGYIAAKIMNVLDIDQSLLNEWGVSND